MNLSGPFIRLPIMTTLLTLALIVIGIYSFFVLPVSNLPDVNYPTITVNASFPGANPTIMANTVATPLEREFMTIPGVKSVVSSNTVGSTNVILQFDISKNIDIAGVDVEAAIGKARPNLPPNLPQDPSYKKVNPSSTPVLFVVLTSPTLTQGELYEYANTLVGQRISIIEGVALVFVYGFPKAVRAQVDPGLIASMGLTLEEVSTSISRGNQYQPLGRFDGTYKAQTIYDTGALLRANNYESLIVAYKNGSPVRMEDIGNVVDSLKDDRGQRRYIDGKIDQPSVTLAVQRQPGANAIQVSNAVHDLLTTLKSQLPGSLETIILFDRAESIRDSIHDVELTLFIAFVLVVLVIYFYLGKLSDTVIPSIVMPLSILGTFAIIYQLGYTLDNLSLLALTLAIGFIIDDAIVVLENIVRHIEEGETPIEASLRGSKQIGFTIVSMTLSLIAVYIPLIFMSGVIGKLFQEFSITLTIVTVMSGIISLTLTPMLCSRFIPTRNVKDESKPDLSHRFNTWVLDRYKSALHWALDHRKTMLLIGVSNVVLTLFFFKILPTDFIPNDDIGFLFVYTEADQDTSSDQMVAYQQQVLEILQKQPYIHSMVSVSSNPTLRQGQIAIRLVPNNQRPGVTDLIQQWNKKLGSIPGLNVYFKNIPLIDLNVGTAVRGNFQYLMQSLDAESLYKSAELLFQKMREDPMFQGVSTDLEVKTPQITLDIDRDQASMLGIDIQNLEKALSLSFSGNRISRVQTPIDQYDVILELNRDMQRNPKSLADIYLRSSTTNQLVPIKALVKMNEGVGPASISHFNQFPAVTITFNIASGIPLSNGLAKVREYAQQSFSSGVIGDVKGAAQVFEESIQSLAFLVIITILSIYLVLGILYESFIHPLTILSTLPPAILGGLLTLYISGMPLSLYAFLGIILLVGIVKKNGIMMVDFALDNVRTKGESPEKSIYDACIVRFRPIMMTTLAAIMGALPIALGMGAGAEARRPLGFVIIGGMFVSQLITLFLTPVIYLYMERLRENWVKKP